MCIFSRDRNVVYGEMLSVFFFKGCVWSLLRSIESFCLQRLSNNQRIIIKSKEEGKDQESIQSSAMYI